MRGRGWYARSPFVPPVAVVGVASLVRGNGWCARTTFRSLVGYDFVRPLACVGRSPGRRL